MEDGLTSQQVGARVKAALDETGKSREWLCAQADISLSKLTRIFKGTHELSVTEMWRIAVATDKPFGWFAGELDPAPERLATAAERATLAIQAMHAALARLLGDLAGARVALGGGDETQLEVASVATPSSKAAKNPGKAVTVPRKATG